MSGFGTVESYKDQIEHTREKMLQAAGKLGLNHPQVLFFSQELDKLHTGLLARMSKDRQVG